MGIWKASFLIDYSSAPTDLSKAASHKGGWSETLWWIGSDAPNVVLRDWANKRAPMLTRTCRIVGARVQTFTRVGNLLVAGGTSAVGLSKQGNPATDPDLPQVSLSLKAQAFGAPNTRRFVLRGMPDEVMKQGEFQPDSNFLRACTEYRNFLAASSWAFPGRDLSKPTVNIVSIITSVLKLTDATLFNVGDYVRLLKVKDLTGKSITGVYRVSVKAGNDLTLENFDGTVVTKNVGKARVDYTAVYPIGTVELGRASVKKIGRPFEQYRGRRSKRRAA